MAMLPASLEIGSETPSAVNDVSYYDVEGGKVGSADEEVLDASPKLIQKVGAELVGTFVLMFIGCSSAFVAERGDTTLLGVAAAWSLAAVSMIYALGHISGAHFNPAVTVAFALVGKFPLKEVPYYVVSQIVSATVACAVLRWLFNDHKPIVMLTLPGPSLSNLNVIAGEIIASFVLMFVISSVASDLRAAKELAGVAIGAAIFIDVLVLGKVTGASMNPARSIGPAIAVQNFKKIWLYIVAPMIGTVSAASVYILLQSPNGPVKKPGYTEKSMVLP